MPDVQPLSLPFDEAITFFRQKISLPTKTWEDLWKDMHSRAFVVAGATKEDLISDLRTAVEKGIADGTTLAEFRKDFDGIISKHGWKYKGARGWRTAVIFNTNVSVAYHAGHWKQMTDPDVLKVRPYLRYVPSSAAEPRSEHMKWYNLVLPADDPFWNTHYPPNDWGCKCGVVGVSERELSRLKKEEAKTAHPIKTKAPKQEYYEWTSPTTGKTHKIPRGIGPGWDYNPGKAAWDEHLGD